jgi:regulatory protein
MLRIETIENTFEIYFDEDLISTLDSKLFKRAPHLLRSCKTLEGLKEKLSTIQYERTKSYGAWLLSRQHYFSDQLKAKLIEKSFPKEIVKKFIDQLQTNGILKDEQWAEQLIISAQNKGLGPYRIWQKLKTKKAPQELIEEFIDKFYSEDLQQAAIKKSYNKKFKKELSTFQEKQKAVQYLQRQGFSLDIIQSFLKTE